MKKLLNKPWSQSLNGWEISLKKTEYDPEGVFRLYACSDDWEVELFPSKGLSVGQARYKSQPLFWEPPIGLIHPDHYEPMEDDILINGQPAPGFSFLKTFASGIELYGLKNWGMPVAGNDGELLPIHGETSNIPVSEVDIEIKGNSLVIHGTFIYRTLKGEPSTVWYNRGDALYEISREISINKDSGKIRVIDDIINVSREVLEPDWGYHVTFFASDEARVHIPSRVFENRGGGLPPADTGTWKPSEDMRVRTETGVIHKGLKTLEHEERIVSRALVKYPDKKSISFTFTSSPYTQSWICSGVPAPTEFSFLDRTPVFDKPWNGIGLELGSSALDHDGNTDDSVVYSPQIKPGEKKSIFLEIEVIGDESAKSLEKEISEFNEAYRKR